MNGKTHIFKKAAVSILAAAMTTASVSALVLNAAAEDILVFEGISFTPWMSTAQLPDTNGSYYLTNDVSISSVKNLFNKKIDLCLNGHSITMSGSALIYNLANGSVFNLYDNNSDEHHYKLKTNAAADVGSGDGVFYGGYLTSTGTNGCIQIMSGATFNMYGGNIVGFPSTGVNVNGGTFNMYGGSILGCYSKSRNGAGVYVTGTFNMTGGEIKDNKVDNYSKGGGVAFYGVSFTVSGDAVITGNKTMNDEPQNAFIKEGKAISIGEGGLSDKASIGLTTGSGTGSAVLVNGAKGNEAAFFSDNTGKSFALNPEGQLVLGDFATATYKQVGNDFEPQFAGDSTASLWQLNVTPGADAITSVGVEVKDKNGEFHGANDRFETPAISSGTVVFAVVVNHAAADISGMNAVINDSEINAASVEIE